MLFTYPFPLKSFDTLRNYTLEKTKHLINDKIYTIRINPPFDIKQLVNSELMSYGLPSAANFLVFKRKNWINTNPNTVHVDYSSAVDQILYASIVLPIDGCEGTSMYWMSGDHHYEKRFLADGDAYKAVVWNSLPTVCNQTEILEPTLCRVDIPHDALSNVNGSYRTILSIRFRTNPTFDEILQTRFGIQC
jgi:hypothetical protein